MDLAGGSSASNFIVELEERGVSVVPKPKRVGPLESVVHRNLRPHPRSGESVSMNTRLRWGSRKVSGTVRDRGLRVHWEGHREPLLRPHRSSHLSGGDPHTCPDAPHSRCRTDTDLQNPRDPATQTYTQRYVRDRREGSPWTTSQCVRCVDPPPSDAVRSSGRRNKVSVHLPGKVHRIGKSVSKNNRDIRIKSETGKGTGTKTETGTW